MEKNIAITVAGTTVVDGEKETITTKCPGKYFLKDDKHYFMYSENTENGLIKSVIKVQDEAMEVTKKGALNMHLFFEPLKDIACTYDTPFGSIPINIYTKRLDMYIESHHIKVVAEYEMRNHDEIMACCELLIVAED
ncbi:MAG: DUF1934 domain-containing protein [Clostridiales bacterium]|nr:DUF1934 domain-containing protein [Clostridiales bacterium]